MPRTPLERWMWALALLEPADEVVEDVVREVAGGDDDAGDAVRADQDAGVLGRSPHQRSPRSLALGLVAVADHADDPEAEIGVALHEVDEVGAFALGADDEDVAEVAAAAGGRW